MFNAKSKENCLFFSIIFNVACSIAGCFKNVAPNTHFFVVGKLFFILQVVGLEIKKRKNK